MLCCDLFVCVFAGNEAAIELEKRVKALEERLNKLENKDLKGNFNMFDSTVDDVMAVYEQLKDRYDLVLTTTSALDEGFTIDQGHTLTLLIDAEDDELTGLGLLCNEGCLDLHQGDSGVQLLLANNFEHVKAFFLLFENNLCIIGQYLEKVNEVQGF